MNLNDMLKLDDDVEAAKDIIGGGGYVKDSGVYLVKINHAFFEESKGGAQGVNLSMKHAGADGVEFNTTIYVTSGKAKGQKPYYISKQGNKVPLPGYTTVDDMCKIASGKPMQDSSMSTKGVEVYDYAASKKVNKEVQVLDALTGAILQIGLDKKLVNKWKDGAPTAETQERNEISKVFDKAGRTVNEAAANATPEFIVKWKEKHDGVTVDDTTIKSGATSSHALPTATTAQSADNTDALFS